MLRPFSFKSAFLYEILNAGAFIVQLFLVLGMMIILGGEEDDDDEGETSAADNHSLNILFWANICLYFALILINTIPQMVILFGSLKSCCRRVSIFRNKEPSQRSSSSRQRTSTSSPSSDSQSNMSEHATEWQDEDRDPEEEQER